MNNEYFGALLDYMTAMTQAKSMLSRGLITADEYEVIETKMCDIFGINFDSLFRENDWINTHFRGNMSSAKEMI